MSRSASVTLEWADGEYPFRLAIGQIEELQEKTDCGPYFLLNRLLNGTWRVHDARETIRLGLIGGGMTPADALKLVKRYVDDRPLLESVKPAAAILSAACIGAPDGEAPGKDKAARAKDRKPSAEMASFPSPPGMEPVQQ